MKALRINHRRAYIALIVSMAISFYLFHRIDTYLMYVVTVSHGTEVALRASMLWLPFLVGLVVLPASILLYIGSYATLVALSEIGRTVERMIDSMPWSMAGMWSKGNADELRGETSE